MHQVIIVGGGPAGLTAGIYSARELLDALLLEKGLCGGLPAVTGLIENYPGFPDGITGMELMEKFKQQAERFKLRINELEEVKKIERWEKSFVVKTDKADYQSQTVIVASGSIPKKLGIPGEKELSAKGVSYCATCDGPLFKGKDVLVVGGGDAAVQEALFLSTMVRKVFLVHRRFQLRAEKFLQEQLKEKDNVELVLNHIPLSVNGVEKVESVRVKEKESGEEKEIPVAGIFIYVGFTPGSDFLQGFVELDDTGRVKIDENMMTSVPGVYAAGDLRSNSLKQIDIACADGTIAAISARNYIFSAEKWEL